MVSSVPHFLLFSEAERARDESRWRFVLESLDGVQRLTATEVEAEDCAERLELLAVVRGLEALEQPSQVTLVTRSRYVSRGIRSGLTDWRNHGWRWEHFGKLVPVRDHDLWQRVDQALNYHQVNCRHWRFDNAHAETPDPVSHEVQPTEQMTTKCEMPKEKVSVTPKPHLEEPRGEESSNNQTVLGHAVNVKAVVNVPAPAAVVPKQQQLAPSSAITMHNRFEPIMRLPLNWLRACWHGFQVAFCLA